MFGVSYHTSDIIPEIDIDDKIFILYVGCSFRIDLYLD